MKSLQRLVSYSTVGKKRFRCSNGEVVTRAQVKMHRARQEAMALRKLNEEREKYLNPEEPKTRPTIFLSPLLPVVAIDRFGSAFCPACGQENQFVRLGETYCTRPHCRKRFFVQGMAACQ
jgi:hypothetical protein